MSCRDHNLPVIYLGKDCKSSELVGYAKNVHQRQNFNFFKQKQLKQIFKQLKIFQKIDDLKTLKNLKEEIKQIKKDLEEELDNIHKEVECLIGQVETQTEKYQNQITANKTLKFDGLIELFEQQKGQYVNRAKKEFIQYSINKFNAFNAFNPSKKSYLSLHQFPTLKKVNKIEIQAQYLFKSEIIATCSKHENERIIQIDFDENVQERLYCVKCLQQNPKKITNLEDCQKIWNQYFQNYIGYFQEFQSLLNTSATIFRQQIQKQFEEAIKNYSQTMISLDVCENQQIVQEQINNLSSKILKFDFQNNLEEIQKIMKLFHSNNNYYETQLQMLKKYLNEGNDLSIDTMHKFFNNMKSLYKNLLNQNQVRQEFDDIAQNYDNYNFSQGQSEINYNNYNFSQSQSQINYKKQIIQQENLQSSIKTYEYKLLDDRITKQVNDCRAIAISHDAKFLIAGCDNNIQVYNLNNGNLKEDYILEGHTETIYCLQFMKNQQKFASGSSDKTIRIWENVNDSWIQMDKLEGHSSTVYCLLFQSNADIIISSGMDKSIIFWGFQKRKWNVTQTILCHNSSVFSLSLNQDQDKLISCGVDKFIYILKCGVNNKWDVQQQIETEQSGLKACFISNNQFIYLPRNSLNMQIYCYDQKSGFQKQEDIPIQQTTILDDYLLFPPKFIESKQILMLKTGQYILIIQKQGNGEFIVKQTIEFEDIKNYGTMTEDGEYLVTWSEQQKEIQFRKYMPV